MAVAAIGQLQFFDGSTNDFGTAAKLCLLDLVRESGKVSRTPDRLTGSETVFSGFPNTSLTGG
jgi:hypothetical protein